MWNLKRWYTWTYLQNRKRLTDIKNKLMVTKGKGGEELIIRLEINIYTLNILYIKKKKPKTQGPTLYHGELYSVFCNNLYGKNLKRIRYMYICNWITFLDTTVNKYKMKIKLATTAKWQDQKPDPRLTFQLHQAWVSSLVISAPGWQKEQLLC